MRARKVDANHTEIREALRAAGATVLDLSGAGRGCPDLLIGFQGRNILCECKDGKKSASKQKLTPAQVEFFDSWLGQVAKVTTPEEAVALLKV
jgi:Holliday junction resolvase